MDGVFSPTVTARQVLDRMGISGPPATHLEEIAQAEHIRVGKPILPDDPNLSGLLLFRGDKRAILINTFIGNSGRINFTFAHELGHYFLRHSPTYLPDGNQGFRCSPDDVQNGFRPKEAEANRFASELLLPEEQFYLSMVGSVLDYTLISNLARQFFVSKHACCNRILEFMKDPYIVIWSKGYEITEIRASAAARRKYLALKHIPPETAAHAAITAKESQSGFTETNPAKWLLNPNSSILLYEWTKGDWPHGVAMTILRW